MISRASLVSRRSSSVSLSLRPLVKSGRYSRINSSHVSLRNCPSPVALERLFFAFGSPSDSTAMIRSTTALTVDRSVISSPLSKYEYKLDPVIHPSPNADTSAVIRTTSRKSRPLRFSCETRRRLSGIGIAISLIFRGAASDVLTVRCAWVSINLAVASEETSARLSISLKMLFGFISTVTSGVSPFWCRTGHP